MLALLLWSTSVLLQVHAAPSTAAAQGQPEVVDADQDPTNLKYQIIAIVGSYVVWTLLTIILIVFVGRRLRRRAQTSDQSLHRVMMKTFPLPETLPLSPRKASHPNMNPPKSPGRLNKNFGRKSHKANPSEYSISTVNSYDEAHRAKNMDELADLYAAVRAHDEEKEARSQVSGMTPSIMSPPPMSPFPKPTSPFSSTYYKPPTTPKVAPELAHLYNSNQLAHPMAPTPVDTEFPEDPYEPQVSRSTNRTSKTTPLSIISDLSSRASGLVSPRRPKNISIKNQRISQPMGSADLRDAHLYSDSTPLSPRLYSPGRPPAPPVQQTYEEYDPEAESEQIQIHMQPQQHSSQYVIHAKDRHVPPALALRNAAALNPSYVMDGSQTSIPSRAPKALPFRQVYGDASLRSAPPTKTTFLDRPMRNFGPKSALKSGVVPQTPYSPYTPFTPMTPITPRRLATREELKRQRKETKLKVLNETDLVSDEGWGA